MGAMFLQLGKYSDAKSCYEKALRIQQRTLPATHADLYSTYANLGTVYFHTGEYPQALSYHQKTLDFFLSDSSANRNELSTCYNNMGVACFHLEMYYETLDYLEKARNVRATHFGLTAPETVAANADIAYMCNTLYNSVNSLWKGEGEYHCFLLTVCVREIKNTGFGERSEQLKGHSKDLDN